MLSSVTIWRGEANPGDSNSPPASSTRIAMMAIDNGRLTGAT